MGLTAGTKLGPYEILSNSLSSRDWELDEVSDPVGGPTPEPQGPPSDTGRHNDLR
jgi:hypothetical protein